MATNGGGNAKRTEIMEIGRIMESDPVEAEARARAFLDSSKGDVNGIYLLGVSLRLQDRLEESVQVLHEAIHQAPDFPVAHQELGIALHTIGRVNEAKTALKEAVRIEPRLGLAWKKLGDVLSEMGDNPGARDAHKKAQDIFNQQNTATAAGVSHTLQEARQCLARGDIQKADTLCRRQLETSPNDVQAIYVLAEIGIQVGAFNDSRRLLEKCIEIDPEFHDARAFLANVLYTVNDYSEALAQLEVLGERQPGNPNNGAIKAKVLAELGDYDFAIEIYEDLNALFKKHPSVLLEFGHTLRVVGRRDDAIKAYREGLSLAPKSGLLWYSLANLKTFRFSEEEVQTMRSALEAGDLPAEDDSHIAFALGKAEEDLGNFEASFEAYDRGNRIKRNTIAYEASANSALTSAMKGTFTAAYFENHKGSGCDKPDPIFVVGLPRSGSTLIEQILASHSLVDGTMELPDINVLTRKIGGSTGPHVPSSYPGVMRTTDENQLLEMGEEYLKRSSPRRGEAPFFVDKMPENFQHIGFIRSILPNAKIIDVRRAPMSNCFSLWKQDFNVGRDYAYALDDIGNFYKDYLELMEHWNAVLPGFVHLVEYENVVNDTETEIRQLLEFCGLPFEEACLNFHRSERSVRTASSEQVRRPIYKDALEQWKRYEDQLGLLKNTLSI
jgi:tetratricopeptide (TPR) repeat protein